MKPKVAIVRGKFLNHYEMQSFEPLVNRYDITAFGSLTPYHDRFAFPVVKLPSPIDLPDFPYKMPILNRIFIDAQYLWGLENRIKGFDIVHSAETYYHYTQQCLNAKKRGFVKKVIATVLENIPFNNEGIWGRKAFKKRAREELDHIIALTQKTKDALIAEGCDPKKITVVGHGINTHRFSPGKKRQSAKKDFTILFSGRLEISKGVFDLLDAAKLILSDSDLRDHALTFVFVGDGSQKGRMIEKEKALGIEQHVIHRQVSYDKMPQEYQHADIFVAPSIPTKTWEEQYSTVLLEAQAAGLPIVSTQTGGIPENVGDAAILVEPGDSRAIARGIASLIRDEKMRTSLGAKAHLRAVGIHDSLIIADKIAKIYENVLAST